MSYRAVIEGAFGKCATPALKDIRDDRRDKDRALYLRPDDNHASNAALSPALLPQRAAGQFFDKTTSIASDQFETDDNTLREALTSLDVRKWRRFNARSTWPAFKSWTCNHLKLLFEASA